jgi:hypothetical protein
MKKFLLLTVFFVVSSTLLLGSKVFSAERGNVNLKVVAVNPSTEKAQTVEINNYLPPEATPENVISTGGLELKYDAREQTLYVYKKGVNLEPGEICIFVVEMKDVWFVPQEELDTLKEQAQNILAKASKENKNYGAVKSIADDIHKNLSEISTSQERAKEFGFKRQLVNYRSNQQILEEINKDIAQIENLLAIDKEVEKEKKKEQQSWWKKVWKR